MERIINRHRALSILVVVLFAQIIGLAVQVRRPGDQVRLIRVWAMAVISPMEKGVVGTGHFFHHIWSGYIDLRGARRENDSLKQELQQIRLQQVRDREDAAQARRLQALLGFKQQFIGQTLPAQVIGSGGGEQSRVVYIDRGSNDGLKPDMAVVTAGGIVGKVTRVISGNSAQVLLINDQLSGVGAMMEKTRLQGIVNGSPSGALVLQYVMSDEKIEPGELVLASGGDRVYPKGMPIGRVRSVNRGSGIFYSIELQPAADLNRLEEVLVITRLEQKPPEVDSAATTRASDILAERLPTVPPPQKTDADGNPLPAAGSTGNKKNAPASGPALTPAAGANANPNPSSPTTPKPKKPHSAPGADNPAAQSSGGMQRPNGDATSAGSTAAEQPTPPKTKPNTKENAATPVTTPATKDEKKPPQSPTPDGAGSPR